VPKLKLFSSNVNSSYVSKQSQKSTIKVPTLQRVCCIHYIPGGPGEDAQYCPCPGRNNGVESHASGGNLDQTVAQHDDVPSKHFVNYGVGGRQSPFFRLVH
jgi:hypothetical protein